MKDALAPQVLEAIRLFGSNETAAKVKFLDGCPPSPAMGIARQSISQPYLEVNLMGLNALAETYSRGIDCNLGVVLSAAIYHICQQALTTSSSDVYLNTAYLSCAGNSLNSWLVGLNNLGKYQDTVQIGENALKGFNGKSYKEAKEHQSMLLLSILEAYIQLAYLKDNNRASILERVEPLLNKTDWSSLSGSYKTTLKQIHQKYDQLIQNATKLPDNFDQSDELTEFHQELDQNLEVLKEGVDSIQEISPGIAKHFKSITEKIEDAQNSTSSDSLGDWVFQNQALADQLTDFFGVFNPSGAQRIQLQKQIRNACSIFADPLRGQNQELIRKSLAVLKEAYLLTQKNNFTEDENDTLWGLYLCYSRLREEDNAIKSLQSLRQNLELLRSRISDPMKRAGIFQKFPYLFASLCQLLCQTGRSEELLNAIEGAKGRVLADVLTAKRGEVIEDSTFSEPVKYLPDLMQKVHAHYLTYFVDDESTYAVLVAKNGSLASAEIPLGKTTLREWSKGIDPKLWGKRPGGLGGPKIPKDLPDRLSPLVAWLAPLTESGFIKQNDHICYCPDEDLHLVPFHYITFHNEPFVKYVSLSRIQGALALISLLQQSPDYISQAIAIQVPLKHEKENSQRDEKTRDKLHQFGRASSWLIHNLKTQYFDDEQADLKLLHNLDLRYQLIHFSTHGIFPEYTKAFEGRDMNPFTGSGLVLAANDSLPDANNLYKKGNPNLLTPEETLQFDFSGSHISMMACVTGLSKEGIGGDALGLEWAFLQAGASSLLGTHWDTDAIAAAEFSLRFYKKWLVQHFPRSAAWRETVLELIKEDFSSRLPSEYFWAAFSLSGDWR